MRVAPTLPFPRSACVHHRRGVAKRCRHKGINGDRLTVMSDRQYLDLLPHLTASIVPYIGFKAGNRQSKQRVTESKTGNWSAIMPSLGCRNPGTLFKPLLAGLFRCDISHLQSPGSTRHFHGQGAVPVACPVSSQHCHVQRTSALHSAACH